MVIILSFQLSMLRVDIIAGTAQATPDMSGTTLLPFSPNLRMILSIINITLDMYPDSSKIEMKVKSNAICGTNINIPPRPAISPCVRRSTRGPSGRCS
jgi:hypothetical protein